MADEKGPSRGNRNNDSTSGTPSVALGQRGIRELLSPGEERRQSMEGFDDDYVDIVDYIIRCTYKIWEQKGLGRIYDHYRHNIIIHTSDGGGLRPRPGDCGIYKNYGRIPRHPPVR